MSDFKQIAKNFICGTCIGVALCVTVVTAMSEKACEPVSICQVVVPHMPDGHDPDRAPSPATGKATTTVLPSAAGTLSSSALTLPKKNST
jgi:hypothetical protein